MGKEIFVYTGIYSSTAELFVEKLNELSDEEDITIRLNSPGGSVFAGLSMIANLKERKGNVNVSVDGLAASMAAYILMYADNVVAFDTSKIMFHQASGWVEKADDQKILDDINSDLKVRMKKRLNGDKFKDIAGISIDDLFKSEEKRDIWLTAKEAKEIGLVDKIVRLSPKQLQAYNEKFVAFTDIFDEVEDDPRGSGDNSGGTENDTDINSRGSDNSNQQITNDKSNEKEEKVIVKQIKSEKKMTKSEFKEQHLEAYNEIFNAGVAAEKDRIEAFLVFVNVDAEAVKKEIEAGNTMSQKFMAEMTQKSISGQIKANGAEEKTESVKTDEEKAEATAEAKQLAEDEKEVMAAAGVKLKDKEE